MGWVWAKWAQKQVLIYPVGAHRPFGHTCAPLVYTIPMIVKSTMAYPCLPPPTTKYCSYKGTNISWPKWHQLCHLGLGMSISWWFLFLTNYFFVIFKFFSCWYQWTGPWVWTTMSVQMTYYPPHPPRNMVTMDQQLATGTMNTQQWEWWMANNRDDEQPMMQMTNS